MIGSDDNLGKAYKKKKKNRGKIEIWGTLPLRVRQSGNRQ